MLETKMTQSSSPELISRHRKFATHQSKYPEHECVTVLNHLFDSLDEAIRDGEDVRAQHIVQFIDNNLNLLDQSLEQESELNKHINSFQEFSKKDGRQDWSSIQKKIDEAEKGGSLIGKRIWARYSELLNRYGPLSGGPKISVEPSVANENLLSDQERLFKCFEAYRYLYLNNIKSIARRYPGILIETIEQLRLAIRSNDVVAAETTVAKARDLLQPTSLLNVPQVKNGVTTSKYIDIVGIAHQFANLEISVKSKKLELQKTAFQANADSSFNLKGIPLVRGKNRIEIHPVGIPELLRHDKLSLTFVVDRAILFLIGRFDPVTKESLEEVRPEDVVRCAKCEAYWLKDIWQYFENRCLICNSTEYWEHDDPNFESLDQ